eukprot:scaffold6888_cov126-Isochrysis_galbana.AAC.1
MRLSPSRSQVCNTRSVVAAPGPSPQGKSSRATWAREPSRCKPDYNKTGTSSGIQNPGPGPIILGESSRATWAREPSRCKPNY